MLHAIVMAGGAGTRFWPASRRLRPKQLLKLAGNRTMIQATVDRLKGLVPAEQVLEQVEELNLLKAAAIHAIGFRGAPSQLLIDLARRMGTSEPEAAVVAVATGSPVSGEGEPK